MASKFETLHGRITGTGDLPIILSHGFGTDQSAWDAIRPRLDYHFRVISYDLAGAGPNGEASYNAKRHASLFGYADDLITILDELNLEGCIYIGHSVSSMIGAAAAAARPELFSRLFMIGGSPRYLNEPGYEGGFSQGNLDALYAGMAANFQAWGAGFAPAVVGVPDHAVVDKFCRTLFLMRPDIALSISRTIFQSDMREVAARVECPTHLVQTSRDMAVPMFVANWLHSHIDGSTLDVIDAEGHLPHMTAPTEVLRVIEQRLYLAA